MGPGIENWDVCCKVDILHACCCILLADLGAGPSIYVAGFGNFLGHVYDRVGSVGDVLMKGSGNGYMTHQPFHIVLDTLRALHSAAC